ncbi:MAG: hypothetical protein CM1200mP2_30140 [Planctomycetaceae bacterium]|nr:MAG: hypothetical protein CM1200mP2_30140 [Planctomycetaceae bacterium]
MRRGRLTDFLALSIAGWFGLAAASAAASLTFAWATAMCRSARLAAIANAERLSLSGDAWPVRPRSLRQRVVVGPCQGGLGPFDGRSVFGTSECLCHAFDGRSEGTNFQLVKLGMGLVGPKRESSARRSRAAGTRARSCRRARWSTGDRRRSPRSRHPGRLSGQELSGRRQPGNAPFHRCGGTPGRWGSGPRGLMRCRHPETRSARRNRS